MNGWPALDPSRDHETFTLLHLASQMIGKLRVRHAPWTNHGWHVALQPTARGLQTLPTAAGDNRTFCLSLDLRRHSILLTTSDPIRDEVPLAIGNVAGIHRALIAMLERHGLPSSFSPRPNELEGPVPFGEDRADRRYVEDSAHRFGDALAAMLPVFERFRAGFVGKSSPLHFWWGSFDLAVTRFSGRAAPQHPGGVPGLPDRVTREAYSHEVSSAGFWAGGAVAAEPFFYSYAYPEPPGFSDGSLAAGRYDGQWNEYILPYDEVRSAADPHALLFTFLQSTYDRAADAASWDRQALERHPVAP